MLNKILNIILLIFGIALIICGIIEYVFNVNVSLFSYCFGNWCFGLFVVFTAIYNHLRERK